MPTSHVLTLPQIRVSDFGGSRPLNKAHLAAVNTADWDAGVKALGDNIPGYRYSATFLSSLRSNLHLSASFPASPISSLPSTPTTAAFSHANLPTYIPSSNPPQRSNHRAFNICQPSWSRIAFVPNGKLPTSHPTSDVRFRSLPNDANSGTETDLPSFSYEVAPVGNSKERAASLELIADSVSQQRRTACRAIVLHTPILTSYLVLLLLGLRYLHYTTLLSTCSTTTLIGLLLIKWLTRGYDKHAKEINWAWLLQNNTLNPPHHPHPNIHTHSTSNINAATTNLASSTNNSLPNSNEPIVLIVRSGSTDDDKIIGTAILRYIKRERKSYIRAWTVSYDERGQGIGEGLLEEAVRMTWARGGRGVEFDPEHAHHKRLSHPPWLSYLGGLDLKIDTVFDDVEFRARDRLAAVVAAQRKEKGSR